MSVALGPTLLGHSLLSIARLRPYSKGYVPSILTSIIAAGAIICVVLSGVYLIDAFSPYIWYQPQDGVPLLNTLNQLIGCLIVSVYTVFGVAALIMAADSLGFSPPLKSLVLRETSRIQQSNDIRARFNGLNFIVLFISFAFIFILTLFLPHVWAITYMPVISWNAYFVLDSPFSLVKGVLLYQSNHTHFSYQNITDPSTNATLLEYLPDPDWLQPMIYLKLYQTVIVYYSVIFGIVVCGIVGTYYTPLRRYLHQRVDMYVIPKAINLWPVGASIGKRIY